jgi:hypothetical protein
MDWGALAYIHAMCPSIQSHLIQDAHCFAHPPNAHASCPADLQAALDTGRVPTTLHALEPPMDPAAAGPDPTELLQFLLAQGMLACFQLVCERLEAAGAVRLTLGGLPLTAAEAVALARGAAAGGPRGGGIEEAGPEGGREGPEGGRHSPEEATGVGSTAGGTGEGTGAAVAHPTVRDTGAGQATGAEAASGTRSLPGDRLAQEERAWAAAYVVAAAWRALAGAWAAASGAAAVLGGWAVLAALAAAVALAAPAAVGVAEHAAAAACSLAPHVRPLTDAGAEARFRAGRAVELAKGDTVALCLRVALLAWLGGKERQHGRATEPVVCLFGPLG